MTPPRPGRWRFGRNLVPALVAGLAALVVGLVCGGLLFGGQPRPGPGTGPSAGAPAGPVLQPAPTDLTNEPRPDADPSETAGRLPADVTFVEVAGVPLPVSASAGPRDTTAGLARGFAAEPAGAVLAAAHILARLHPQVGADVFAPTLAAQVVGPDAETLAASVERGYGHLLELWPVAYGQPAGQLDFTIVGYRLDSYSPGTAQVRLLLEVPSVDGTLLGATELGMRWRLGDWVLLAPAGGVFATTSLVDSAAGFTPWPVEGS